MPLLVINFGNKEIRQKLDILIMKASELAETLNNLGTQLEKASAEIKGKITELEGAISNSNVELPAAVQQALDNLKEKTQKLDDMVPDPIQDTVPSPEQEQGSLIGSTEGEETTNT